VREQVLREESKLAAIQLPQGIEGAQREALREAIGDSFVAGFRWVMGIGAGLAVLSALCALLTIAPRR